MRPAPRKALSRDLRGRAFAFPAHMKSGCSCAESARPSAPTQLPRISGLALIGFDEALQLGNLRVSPAGLPILRDVDSLVQRPPHRAAGGGSPCEATGSRAEPIRVSRSDCVVSPFPFLASGNTRISSAGRKLRLSGAPRVPAFPAQDIDLIVPGNQHS